VSEYSHEWFNGSKKGKMTPRGKEIKRNNSRKWRESHPERMRELVLRHYYRQKHNIPGQASLF
jgi:hypothetical protein